MTFANKFLGQGKSQALSQAYDVASQIMSSSSSPQDALKKANVSPAVINKLQGLLANPLASSVLKPLGLDVAETKAMLEQLQATPPAPTNGTPQGSELQELQKTLEKLKRVS
jgi:hypothetical protein